MRLIYCHRSEEDKPTLGTALYIRREVYEDQGSYFENTNLSFIVQYVHTTYKACHGMGWESDITVLPMLDGGF